MTKVHGTDIRFKCILKTLHSLLYFVLKFAIENHDDDDKISPDLDTRLAKIIFKSSNKSKFERKQFVKDKNYKKHFYLNNNSEKSKVIIKDLDVTVLSNLIITPFMNKKSFYKNCQCCSKCNHECKCGKDFLFNVCTSKSNCSYDTCLGCKSSKPCEYMEIINFVKICKSFRGSISHLKYAFFDDFETGKQQLNDFPCSGSLRNIWDVINESSINCLNILMKYNVIDSELFQDYEMHIRVALKYDVSTLVHSIDVNHYYKVILGEDNSREKMKEFQNFLLEYKQGYYYDF